MDKEFQEGIVGHVPALRRYAVALIRNRERADDLVHETLLKAIEKQSLFTPGTNLRAWLFKILHNVYVDHVRQLARHSTIAIDNAPLAERTQAADQEASLLRRDLETALAQLPEEQRTTLLLVGLEHLTYEQVADIMDVPIGTVRSRLARARQQLRAAVGLLPRSPDRSARRRRAGGG